jgi:hypothetical protein
MGLHLLLLMGLMEAMAVTVAMPALAVMVVLVEQAAPV